MNENLINTIVEVKEVDSDDQLNRLLEKGWILLAAIGQSRIDKDGTSATVLYSVGKPA